MQFANGKGLRVWMLLTIIKGQLIGTH